MSLTFDFDVNPSTNQTNTLGSASTKWLLNGYLPELIEIQVEASNETSVTINNSNITEDHIVINEHMQIAHNVDYITSDGSISLSCSSGIPGMVLYLGVKA